MFVHKLTSLTQWLWKVTAKPDQSSEPFRRKDHIFPPAIFFIGTFKNVDYFYPKGKDT